MTEQPDLSPRQAKQLVRRAYDAVSYHYRRDHEVDAGGRRAWIERLTTRPAASSCLRARMVTPCSGRPPYSVIVDLVGLGILVILREHRRRSNGDFRRLARCSPSIPGF